MNNFYHIWLLNNIWINAKYRQMAFWSPSDGAPISEISPNQLSFGIPVQTKVSGDRQRETTHEICCLSAELEMEEIKEVKLVCIHELETLRPKYT